MSAFFLPAVACYLHSKSPLPRNWPWRQQNALTEEPMDLRLRTPVALAEGVVGPRLKRFLPKQPSLLGADGITDPGIPPPLRLGQHFKRLPHLDLVRMDLNQLLPLGAVLPELRTRRTAPNRSRSIIHESKRRMPCSKSSGAAPDGAGSGSGDHQASGPDRAGSHSTMPSSSKTTSAST